MEADSKAEYGSERLQTVMELYKIAHETQRYEGDGIWSRFNILFTLNSVLLGVATFIFKFKPESAQPLLVFLSIAGASLSLWAVYVLHRLWSWHDYWKSCLVDLENQLPEGLPRMLANRPASLQTNSTWTQTWIKAYTQPFMLTMLVLWIALGILSVVSPFQT